MRSTIAFVLGLAAFIWGGIGLANIVAIFNRTAAADPGIAAIGFVFNGAVFVIPGLIVLGIAAIVGRRERRSAVEPPAVMPAGPGPQVIPGRSIESRLAELERLRASGRITEPELASARADILRGG
jgi:hypothetical protein